MHIPTNINDAVTAALDPTIGSEVVIAYVDAFRLGFRILAGIAVLSGYLPLRDKFVSVSEKWLYD